MCSLMKMGWLSDMSGDVGPVLSSSTVALAQLSEAGRFGPLVIPRSVSVRGLTIQTG